MKAGVLLFGGPAREYTLVDRSPRGKKRAWVWHFRSFWGRKVAEARGDRSRDRGFINVLMLTPTTETSLFFSVC